MNADRLRRIGGKPVTANADWEIEVSGKRTTGILNIGNTELTPRLPIANDDIRVDQRRAYVRVQCRALDLGCFRCNVGDHCVIARQDAVARRDAKYAAAINIR